MTADPVRSTSRVKVVELAASAEWAGGERYIELLARHLDRTRFVVDVIVPAPGPLADALRRLDVAVHVVPLEPLVSLRRVQDLAALLRRLAPDVLQSHGARTNFYARLAGRLAGVRAVVSTVHNSLRDYPVSAARRTVYVALDRLTLPLAARVLCVADALARDYGARAVVIPNGVDLARFDPAGADGRGMRATLGLASGPVVGFVGRHTDQKDPLTFLRVVAAVRREVPAVQALVVGDGPLRGALQTEARRLGLACVFTGARPDVPALLAAMDLVVLSSRSEGFPFVVLEAMAMERAVVATAVNGVPEIIEHGVSGLIAPPADVGALTAAALDALRDPARRAALGRAARGRVATRFTVDRMVERTEALFLELAGGSLGARALAGATRP